VSGWSRSAKRIRPYLNVFLFPFFLYSPTSFHGRPSFALPFHMSSTFSINIYEDIISFKITRFHQKFLSTTLLQEWLNLDFLKREEGEELYTIWHLGQTNIKNRRHLHQKEFLGRRCKGKQNPKMRQERFWVTCFCRLVRMLKPWCCEVQRLGFSDRQITSTETSQ